MWYSLTMGAFQVINSTKIILSECYGKVVQNCMVEVLSLIRQLFLDDTFCNELPLIRS